MTLRKLCATLLLVLAVCPFTAPFRTLRAADLLAASNSPAGGTVGVAPSPDHPGSALAPIDRRFRPLAMTPVGLVTKRTAVPVVARVAPRSYGSAGTRPSSIPPFALRV
jgi:hypothetical protein